MVHPTPIQCHRLNDCLKAKAIITSCANCEHHSLGTDWLKGNISMMLPHAVVTVIYMSNVSLIQMLMVAIVTFDCVYI